MTPEVAPGEHLSAEDFYGFIEKRLNRARREDVEAHLDVCAECVQDLAVILEAAEPGSAVEEARLATLPGASATLALAKLRGQIVASAPGPGAGQGIAWRRLIPPAAALAVAAVLITLVNAYIVAPARGRGLASRALSELVRVRQGTGRVPLRYVRGFERARVTRSSFDTDDPTDGAVILERLHRAVELAPRDVEPLLALGLVELDGGALDSAEKSLHAALALDPHSVDARNALAVVYYQRFQRGDGESWLQQGLDLLANAQRDAPHDLQVGYNLGMFYKAMNRPEGALRAFRLYVNTDVSSEWSRMAKEYISELEATNGR